MIVLIETPFKDGDRNLNLRYLAWCEYHSASSCGEFPIASHGNCTVYWPETEEGRARGFAWRAAMREAAEFVVFYVDLGMCPGMTKAMAAEGILARIKVRSLPRELFYEFEAGEWPPGSVKLVAKEDPCH